MRGGVIKKSLGSAEVLLETTILTVHDNKEGEGSRCRRYLIGNIATYMKITTEKSLTSTAVLLGTIGI